MKYSPLHFSDLLYVMEKWYPVELVTIVNALTEFCRGVEHESLDKVVAHILLATERGTVERSVRNLGFRESESKLEADHGSFAKAHSRLSDDGDQKKLEPDTIRKIIRDVAYGEGVELAQFIESAKAGKDIEPKVRKVVIAEITKIRGLLLKNSGKGRELRTALSGDSIWRNVDLGRSEVGTEIFDDVENAIARGGSATSAYKEVADRHCKTFGAIKKEHVRAKKKRQEVELSLMRDEKIRLTPLQIKEALARQDLQGMLSATAAAVAVKNLVSGGTPFATACEIVGKELRLSSYVVEMLFKAIEQQEL